MASGLWDTTIKIWNIEIGQCIKNLEIRSARVNGELISGSADNTIKVWDLNKEGRRIKTQFASNDDFITIVLEQIDKTPL